MLCNLTDVYLFQAGRHDDSSTCTSRNCVFGARSFLSRVSLIVSIFGVITFGFHKTRGISWLADDLLASQEGLCSMELVSYLVSSAQPRFWSTWRRWSALFVRPITFRQWSHPTPAGLRYIDVLAHTLPSDTLSSEYTFELWWIVCWYLVGLFERGIGPLQGFCLPRPTQM
jgi:hypothetical protein